MPAPQSGPSAAEIATEANALLAGLSIITFALFPFAVPCLLLVVATLVVLGLPAVLLAGILLPPLWLARTVGRRLSRRRSGGLRATRHTTFAESSHT